MKTTENSSYSNLTFLSHTPSMDTGCYNGPKEELRRAELSEDDRALEEAGLKYPSGTWTRDARHLFLEELMDAHKDDLVAKAKKIVEARKAK